MRSSAAYWTCNVLGAVLCFIAARQILHYGQNDGARLFLLGIVLPFSCGFALFVLAAQLRRRRS